MLLTVHEAAALLQSSERALHRWVDDGEIPFQLLRDQLRFSRTDLLEWATSRRLPISLRAFDAGADDDEPLPSLADAIRANGVHADVVAGDRDSALRAVVDATALPPGLDRELLREVLVARENACSTALGDGIAIPHVRQPVVAPGAQALVSVCHLAKPVAFGTGEGTPVHTIFLIVSPTVRAHLQMLARLARALHDPGFRAALASRQGTERLVAEAARLEAAPSSRGGSTGAR